MTALLATAPAHADAAVPCVEDLSPTGLADALADARARETAAGIDVLKLAVAWADAHPALDDEGRPIRAALVDSEVLAAHFVGIDPDEHRDGPLERPSWAGLPPIAWDAEAGFALAAGLCTRAGSALLRDALILRHRLPRTWARVLASGVPAWRARLIACEVAGAPDDVCETIDAVIAPVAHKAGTLTVRRLVNETMLALYANHVAEKSWQDLERRYVRFERDSIGHTGIAGMDIRADYADLDDLDKLLTELAQRLPGIDPACIGETLDQRRARALGVLADPARAQQVLDGQPMTADPADPAGSAESASDGTRATPGAAPKRLRRRTTTLVLGISDLALLGLTDVGCIESGLRAGDAVLAETIAGWCGREATDLTILPVLDLQAHRAGSAYAAPETLRRHLALRDRHCLFPYCDRPAARCDCDHVVPHTRGGPTCSCNTIPLCRHHHRLKTHAGYSPALIEPGVVWWHTPYGHQFIVDTDGTVPVHRAPPDAGRACITA